MPKPYHKHSGLWRAAHDHVNKLNRSEDYGKEVARRTQASDTGQTR